MGDAAKLRGPAVCGSPCCCSHHLFEHACHPRLLPQALTELCSRSHQVLALPLLALSRAWQAQLSGQAAARPLVVLMAALSDKLQGQWVGFIQAQAAAVEQYDGRSKMGLQQGEQPFGGRADRLAAAAVHD
jgi:hypothetical protein